MYVQLFEHLLGTILKFFLSSIRYKKCLDFQSVFYCNSSNLISLH